MNPALVALFLGAFSIGTTEFVPAGLLPDIARDLDVSVPVAGLLISAYAAGVAIGGPIVSLLTSKSIPSDIHLKMLRLHAPEEMGLSKDYIVEH